MSTLLTDPGIVELDRADSPRSAPPAPGSTASGDGARPLHMQLVDLLQAAGLAKSDMFMFIALYGFVILLVACLCLATRLGHSQAVQWGARLMNLPLAFAGLALLILATASSAAAIHFARRSNRRPTIVALGLATLGCLGFGATILIDMDAKWRYGIRPGEKFNPSERYVAQRYGVKLPKKQPAESSAALVPVAAPVRSVSAINGRRLFLGTCLSCHGPRGEGLPGQGKSLQTSEFVASLDDAKLLQFLKVGRQPWDPANTTKVQMPPRGGNPMLIDDDLRDIVAFARTLQTVVPAAAGAASATKDGASSPAVGASAAAAALAEPIDPALLLQRWVVSPPPPGPAGLSPGFLADSDRPKWKPPRDGVAFANSYYLATQFGGLHAGALAIAFAALFVQAWRGRITAQRRAPLVLGLVGAVGMTMLWLCVFPCVYVV